MRSFEKAVDLAMEDPELAGLRPVIEKEILHYDILHAIDKENLLQDLVFQGGTCLRLCYGAPRFSEDLDFVGGIDFTPRNLMAIRDCVMDHIGNRYGLSIRVKEPADMRRDPLYFGVAVDRWRISVTTQPERPDFPAQKIKLEVASIPAHSSELMPPLRNYKHLPDGYEDVLVPCESLDEIMADKIVSLTSCTTHPRYRDIWDLRWLKQNGASADPEMIEKKIEDYRIENFKELLEARIMDLPGVISCQKFSDEMERFISPEAKMRTFARPGFDSFLSREVGKILSDAKKSLYEEPEPEMEFML